VRRLIVPVDLGGSPTPCRVRPPLRPAPAPEVVHALIEHYARDRAPAGGVRLEVAFFHGGVPDDALLAACRPYPVRVSCSPADLGRDDAARLVAAGVETIELEVLTFDAAVLRGLARAYAPARALAMLAGLRARGVRVGVTLMPGLPGSIHAGALADADRLARADPPLADFVRVTPALAFAGSGLEALAASGAWVPMRLGEAVTTCAAILDRFEDAGLPVVRVGMQPGHDVPVAAVAGPVHPGLRGLVEARRYRRRMQEALVAVPRSRPAVLRVNPKDVAWARGTANANVRALRAALGLPGLRVEPDPGVDRGVVEVA
jgi:hypothetical protein